MQTTFLLHFALYMAACLGCRNFVLLCCTATRPIALPPQQLTQLHDNKVGPCAQTFMHCMLRNLEWLRTQMLGNVNIYTPLTCHSITLLLWDWHYSMKYSHIQSRQLKYSMEHCQFHKTMLWIWIMLCLAISLTFHFISLTILELVSMLEGDIQLQDDAFLFNRLFKIMKKMISNESGHHLSVWACWLSPIQSVTLRALS
jgi:hypothetical protein